MATKLTPTNYLQIDYLTILQPARARDSVSDEAMKATIAEIREIAKTMPLPKLSAFAVDSLPEDFVARKNH